MTDGRSRSGESILDCHAVQGSFSKTFGRFLRPKSAGKVVPGFPGMGLLQPPWHRWSLAGSSLWETCPQCRRSCGICSSPRSPWAQQFKLPCLSPALSQNRKERTSRHLSGARPEQREAMLGKQGAAETQTCLPQALGTAIWPVLKIQGSQGFS